MTTKKALLTIGALLFLGILYYAVSPLFRNVKVDDSLPASESPAILNEALFPIVGTTGHPASGGVRLLKTDEGVVLRYENFKTINGPDLHVYLAKDLDGKEFIDLGAIKGTEGNINYTVPEGVDVSSYKYVMHWCVPFRVLFNYAEIN